MDALLPLFCLLVGFALPVVALGWLLRRGAHQLRASSAYREVSQRLGLSVDTRGVSLQGHLEGRRLWVGEVMVGHGSERRLVPWGVVDLARPLGLGLLVRHRGLSKRLRHRVTAQAVRLDGNDHPSGLEVYGDDPERVRSLLVPDVTRAMDALRERWPDVALTDHSVRVFLKRHEHRADDLQDLVERMLDLARVVETARQRVPPPTAIATLQQTWEALSARHGLVMEPWLPAIVGPIDGRMVVVAPRRESSGYATQIRLVFPPVPRRGLRLRTQVEPDGFWSVGQDIQIGIPAFDRRFVIKGWDPLGIRELMTPELREVLLELAELGQLDIDDDVLDLRAVSLDSDVIDRALSGARRAAELLQR